MDIVAVVGSKKSGKTTTIETLVGGLVERGYSAATVKHVSEEDFSLDTKGKDSWRHSHAGAHTTIIVSPRELATIKKIDMSKMNLEDILANLQDIADVLVIEGLTSLVKQDPNVLKIVVVKNLTEAKEASRKYSPIIAFAGVTSFTERRLDKPFFNVRSKKLVEHVLSHISKK